MTQARGKRRIPKGQANILVDEHLRKHPEATLREIQQATGVSSGGISESAAWRAEKDRRRRNPGAGSSRDPKARPLTRKMLAVLGETDDPSDRIDAEDIALRKLLENSTSEERARLLAMTREKQREYVQLYMEQLADQADSGESRLE
jgi:hypothetical protein